MKKYLFETVTTMKEYNCQKYWICEDIIPTIQLETENLKEALQKYREQVCEKTYVSISDNALQRKNAMYIDTPDGAKQVGYVITGKTEIKDWNNNKWSTQYIDLWVTIKIVTDVDF
jgi:hypothetical protein